MKPQEHISPESWRHEDAALRRALQQRNNALPQLPEGFADQIQTQLSESVQALQSESVQTQLPAQPAADSSKHSHRLLLWPMIAAAVVIIALFINLPSLIHEQPEHDELVQAPERPVIHSTQEFPTQAPNRPSITHTPERPLIAQTTNRSSSITATPQSGTTATPLSQAATTPHSGTSATPQSGTTAAPLSQAATTPHSGTSATPQSENAPLPESISTPVVGGSSADTPADTPANNPPTSTISSPTSPSPSITAPTSPLNLHITLTFSPTAAGTDLALNEPFTYSNNPDYNNFTSAPVVTIHDNTITYDDKYYIPAGDGYTYAEQTSTSSNNHSGSTRSAPIRHIEKAEALNKSKHSLPFTASLMVNLPLTKRLALETGLSYSRLHSTFDHGYVTFYQHTQQTLHYLGLPLHLHYSFISRNRWRFYGLAGLQVDFPVSTTAEITHQAPYGSSTPTTEHLSAPVQFAPVIGLGAQLNLSRHAALFVQPSLQWYIHTGSSIKTYRSEHPLTFAIPFGFRWTL